MFQTVVKLDRIVTLEVESFNVLEKRTFEKAAVPYVNLKSNMQKLVAFFIHTETLNSTKH